jgi:hypothetical protein
VRALAPSADISLASVVCRSAKSRGPVIIERWLEGASRGKFEARTLAETPDACVQSVDVVPEERLRPGVLGYHAAARIGDEIAAVERRTLRIGTKP